MAIKEATLGAGCFWCTEAIFRRLEGVIEVFPGFSGGHIKNPAYKEVCEGRTGHVEVARIKYDTDILSFEQLLKVFWVTHDPTTLNRQGNDIGEHYKSVVFYHDESQKKLAEEMKMFLDGSGVFPKPIVTEITPLTNFYHAESYHKDYFENNPNQAYCENVIRPKVEKFEAMFGKK